MTAPTRRELIAASGLAIAVAPPFDTVDAAAASITNEAATIAADLDRYVGFGIKASGGPGDNASGAWLQAELERSGFAVTRQLFDVPWFAPSRAELVYGTTTAAVIPQGIVVPTSSDGAAGPLVRVDPVTGPAASLTGAIALIDLPFARWSSALARPVRAPIDAAFAAGAIAAVIVTNGPTGEAVALNARGDAPMFAGPVAILAPGHAAPFLIAAARGAKATLHVTGEGGRRPAFNLVGRIDRGKGRWITVSTPRSGWFTCAGERGPGIAAWLALMRWAPSALTGHNLAFVCNSGHEYEYLGAERTLADAVPLAADTALWLHLGANVAARDWHEPGGGALLPLPSTDPQRFLVTSPTLLAVARRAFAGQAGLEMAYPAQQGSAGEMSNILAAGYTVVAGIFGAHRFHHTQSDDARCVDAAATGAVAHACKALLASV